MNRYLKIFLISLIALPSLLNAQHMNVESGELHNHEHIKSDLVNQRIVRVWTPPNYSKHEKYAVLYMHDGQHLFDSAIAWNGEEWNVDGKMSELIEKGSIKNCIVVGLDNAGLYRHTDYLPQKVYNEIPEDYKVYLDTLSRYEGSKTMNGEVNSDNYLKFIVEVVKPFVDKHYSTLPDRDNTFIAGSSMGGLISLYAICEYPEVFGGAACLSTHWTVSYDDIENPVPDLINHYLKQNLPDPASHKIYFDYGTHGLDELYEIHQKDVDKTMESKGYNSSNWMTKKFDGAGHDEDSWRARLGIPLEFLLAK